MLGEVQWLYSTIADRCPAMPTSEMDLSPVWPDHGDFRPTPVNGHSQDGRACLKGANSRLMRRGKFRPVDQPVDADEHGSFG